MQLCFKNACLKKIKKNKYICLLFQVKSLKTKGNKKSYR